MNFYIKLVLSLVIALIFISTANADEVHNETVCINDLYITNISHNESDWYTITKGQTFVESSLTLSKSGPKQSCISFIAGRKNSSDNVHWVQQQFESEDISWSTRNMSATNVNSKTDSAMPKDLNFAVKVNLTVNYNDELYTCNNGILGQGSYNTPWKVDNWWFFSNSNYEKNGEYETMVFKCSPVGSSLVGIDALNYKIYGTDEVAGQDSNVFSSEIINTSN